MNTTVLFTPITTVIVAGEKLIDWFEPAPLGMDTDTDVGVDLVVVFVLELGEVMVDDVEVCAF